MSRRSAKSSFTERFPSSTGHSRDPSSSRASLGPSFFRFFFVLFNYYSNRFSKILASFIPLREI
ncbi:hypothetical protein AKJ65_03245 [candidate division MSBL1 archaeon SCGC-AAA259E19]|uniref:Uncharacterized protein n=1 Tax=candidate division MSBL1 archaeon SCGC-AAA259E19 TaxID=1698264 RepID=A0A133UKV2_9EURY|nr:hypothetical protein AKJ65_03245 [candidate division MSBL1 archaeon SCGC-AAA259E19]